MPPSQHRNDRRGPRLPEFIAVGPPRTGTTWLHQRLEGHVGLPARVKETNFFDSYYEHGLDWYLSHFKRCDPALPVGEVCTYFAIPAARERIQRHIPDCRIIVTLRDPVARTYSYYKLMRWMAYTRDTFENVLATRPHVSEVNRYAFHLNDWFERFGRERVLVLLYDDLRADPQGFLDRVCDFIGIGRIALAGENLDDDSVNAVRRQPRSYKLAQNGRHMRVWMKSRRMHRTHNFLESLGFWEFCAGRGADFPPLTLEQDARVRARYRQEVEAIEKLIGRDLSAWKIPRGERPRAQVA
ncbi:MAG: sulfotransferase domain-containing protein [Candidatus Binatus sp.]